MTTQPGPVLEATDKAIAAAKHLTDMDAGAVAALRELAAVVDSTRAGSTPDDMPKARGMGGSDNAYVSYLKFCDQLGLTPAGREKLGDLVKEAPIGKLHMLRSKNASNAG